MFNNFQLFIIVLKWDYISGLLLYILTGLAWLKIIRSVNEWSIITVLGVRVNRQAL